MTYVIAEPCISSMDQSCIGVCPVDCIHVFERILVIDPVECIDCGACAAECPVQAIYAEPDVPEPWSEFTAITYAYPEGPEPVTRLVDEYIRSHDVEPKEPE